MSELQELKSEKQSHKPVDHEPMLTVLLELAFMSPIYNTFRKTIFLTIQRVI